MAHRSYVPKFGDWENEGNVPYTVYFDKASKGKGNEKMNIPGDPQESFNPKELEKKAHKGPDIRKPKRQTEASSVPFRYRHGHVRSNGNMSEPEARRNLEASRSNHEQTLSGKDGSQRRPNPLHTDYAGDRKTVRPMAGSGHGIKDLRSRPNQQARVGVRGSSVSSHQWERNASSQSRTSHGFAPSTHGRSRLKSSSRSNEDPDHSSAVPRFGNWDESNPASGEAYTGIFNRMRQERQSQAETVPVSENSQTQLGNEKKTKGRCCFPWMVK